MRIKRVFVKKLFNLFDHEINMNMDDRITIIHVPNGFGKTTILRMIDGLFQARYLDLRNVPFAEFGVEFEDGRTLKVETQDRKGNGKESRKARRGRTDERSLVLSIEDSPAFELPSHPDTRAMPMSFMIDAVEHILPELTHVGAERWQTPFGEMLDLSEVFSRYPQFREHLPQAGGREPAWLTEVRNSVEVRFIRAERLMAPPQAAEESPVR